MVTFESASCSEPPNDQMSARAAMLESGSGENPMPPRTAPLVLDLICAVAVSISSHDVGPFAMTTCWKKHWLYSPGSGGGLYVKPKQRLVGGIKMGRSG